MKDNLRYVLLLLIIVVGLGVIYIYSEAKQETGLGFPLDDPWIHLRFAKNLAQGHGFCYNKGEPVSGSTSPLWTFLLVPIHLIFKNPTSIILAVKIVGIFLFYLSVAFSYFLILKITKNRIASFIGAILISTTIHLNWGSISGLEIPLYLLLTIVFLNLYYGPPKKYKKFAIPVILGLTVYARPECMLLFIFYIVDKVIISIREKRKSSLFPDLAFYIITILPYFIFNLSLSGSIFPNTFRIKAQDQSILTAIATFNLGHLKRLFFVTAPQYFSQFIQHLYRANPLLSVGFFFGIGFWIYRKIKFNKPKTIFIPVMVILYSTFIGLVSPFLGADFQGGRYIANQTALGVLISFVGFFWLWEILKNRYKRTVHLIIGILAAIFIYNGFIAQKFMVKYFTSNVRSINTIQVHLGKWVKENTPSDVIIAVNDVGAIGYYSDRKIIDLVGLITPEIKTYFEKYQSSEVGAYAFIVEKKPDYLVIFPKWYPLILLSPIFESVYSVSLKNNTASEHVFNLQTETFLVFIYKRIFVKPIESKKVVLRAHWY